MSGLLQNIELILIESYAAIHFSLFFWVNSLVSCFSQFLYYLQIEEIDVA